MSERVGQGGTHRFRIRFKDGSGGLVNPINPLVDVNDALGASRVTDAVPVQESTGVYTYDYTVPVDGPLGTWESLWTGTINGVLVSGSDFVDVVSAGSVEPWEETGDLITLAEFATAMGKLVADLEPDEEALYGAAITAASDAIREYTGRSLGVATTRAERTYAYDGSGFLDIDDATHIYSVDITPGGLNAVARTLDASEWRAEEFMGAVFSWMLLPSLNNTISPLMGFTRNMDVLAAEGRLLGASQTVTVDADWGWPTVPPAAKQAAIWTAAAFVKSPEPYVRESIDTYSRSFESRAPVEAIPARAKELLTPYVRLMV